MEKVCWPYFDPDFDNFPDRIYGPPCRVCIDNESMEDCTVIKVDSMNKQGLLLEVVQVLTDMNLIISKGYISSDCGWFMDVFHVKDEAGNKITNQIVINYISQAIGMTREIRSKTNLMTSSTDHSTDHHPEQMAIEITGTDRPGLFSEISAALADLHCNILEAHAWSHNTCLACVAYVSDQTTDNPIDDPNRLAIIEDHLTTVLQATNGPTSSATHICSKVLENVGFLAGQGTVLRGGTQDPSLGTMSTNVERRLHQMMLSVRDFDVPCGSGMENDHDHDQELRKTMVEIENCEEKGYSIVSVKCKDRRRLMFDTVCTLTDMQYVIFHASIGSQGNYAFQEYFIRHIDGCPLNTEYEKDRVIKCLEAAIERRVSEGVRLELRADNRVGLLSDITRVLRENGLTVVRADIDIRGGKAVNAFYVRDISGNKIDMEFVESVRREMGPINLTVDDISSTKIQDSDARHRFSLRHMLKSQIERFSHSFVPIR